MQFLLYGIVYEVKFSRVGTSTKAELWRRENAFWDCTNIVGWSECNPKDRFEKSKGRKISLTKLIKRMQQISAGDVKPEFLLPKEIRAYIWEEYFKIHRKG